MFCGCNANRFANAISGTVFNDKNGNTVFDAPPDVGQGGVTVKLYIDDGDTPGQVDPNDTFIQ